MQETRLYAAELVGIDARLIEVEVDINVGLHAFTVVGLADKALNEARERVNSALKNSGAKPPNRENRRITVNLAPADVKKNGSQYDLAISLGYLLATGQLREFRPEDKLFLGELALNGRVRPVSGCLCIAEMARRKGIRSIFLPSENAREAAAIDGIDIVPIDTLSEAMAILEERTKARIMGPLPAPENRAEKIVDIGEVRGQDQAKRALLIAASGSHNMLMSGPPGVGKTMLARALSGILPALTPDESVEVTKIYSAAGMRPGALVTMRPFRSPHQSSSPAAILGGGSFPRPGEVSLAHNGVLFLDEAPEFPRNILESLRQPLEEGNITVSRTRETISFPARFFLVIAMNPCPCGYYGDEKNECVCPPPTVERYRKKISGPLMDRIDLRVPVGRVDIADLREEGSPSPESPSYAAIVSRVRKIQQERCATDDHMRLDKDGIDFLSTLEKFSISPRAYRRLMRVARTIADIDNSECITLGHLMEAFSYRVR